MFQGSALKQLTHLAWNFVEYLDFLLFSNVDSKAIVSIFLQDIFHCASIIYPPSINVSDSFVCNS